MALVNKGALDLKETLATTDVLLVLEQNQKQKNAGNKGITVADLLTYLEDQLDEVVGNLEVTGTLTVDDTTDSTSKDTGSVILQGGMGVEKSIFAGLTINAGTSMTLGTDFTMAKEVNHSISVSNSTTAATAGGQITIQTGKGNTTGAGGALLLVGGAGGATGAGAAITITTGAGGSTSGASGAATLQTGDATVGSSGSVTVQSGNTGSGVAGDVILTTGTHTSTTVVPVVSINKATVRKPSTKSIATGGTLTGPEVVGGYIEVTGGTGNVQLPTCAQITTAIGSTPAGTNFEFVVNCAGMTATNTATLLVGASMTVASAPAITGGGTLTCTQDTQVTAGFKIVYDTATTCKIYRLW